VKTHAANAGIQLIAYGLDESGKPKAGRFTPKEAEAAREAASSMKLIIREVVSPKDDELAKLIPPGRVHGKGGAFIPYIKRELYEQLAAGEATGTAGPKPTGSALEQSLAHAKAQQASALPSSWDVIAPGSVVLLQESLRNGWFEAIVVARENEQLTIRFRDYPEYPNFVRHIRSVGLMHPGV
jgi:hypothetical protein